MRLPLAPRRYYLSQGFRVVAVEANRKAIEARRRRKEEARGAREFGRSSGVVVMQQLELVF